MILFYKMMDKLPVENSNITFENLPILIENMINRFEDFLNSIALDSIEIIENDHIIIKDLKDDIFQEYINIIEFLKAQILRIKNIENIKDIVEKEYMLCVTKNSIKKIYELYNTDSTIIFFNDSKIIEHNQIVEYFRKKIKQHEKNIQQSKEKNEKYIQKHESKKTNINNNKIVDEIHNLAKGKNIENIVKFFNELRNKKYLDIHNHDINKLIGSLLNLYNQEKKIQITKTQIEKISNTIQYYDIKQEIQEINSNLEICEKDVISLKEDQFTKFQELMPKRIDLIISIIEIDQYSLKSPKNKLFIENSLNNIKQLNTTINNIKQLNETIDINKEGKIIINPDFTKTMESHLNNIIKISNYLIKDLNPKTNKTNHDSIIINDKLLRNLIYKERSFIIQNYININSNQTNRLIEIQLPLKENYQPYIEYITNINEINKSIPLLSEKNFPYKNEIMTELVKLKKKFLNI